MKTVPVSIVSILLSLFLLHCSAEPSRYDLQPEYVDSIQSSHQYWLAHFSELGGRPMDLGAFAAIQTVAKENAAYKQLLDRNFPRASLPKGIWLRLMHKSYGKIPDLDIIEDTRRSTATSTITPTRIFRSSSPREAGPAITPTRTCSRGFCT